MKKQVWYIYQLHYPALGYRVRHTSNSNQVFCLKKQIFLNKCLLLLMTQPRFTANCCFWLTSPSHLLEQVGHHAMATGWGGEMEKDVWPVLLLLSRVSGSGLHGPRGNGPFPDVPRGTVCLPSRMPRGLIPTLHVKVPFLICTEVLYKLVRLFQ